MTAATPQATNPNLTVKQVAERIGISPSLVYDLCRFGALRHARYGRPGKRGTIRVPEEALAEYVNSREQGTASLDEEGPLRHIR